MGVILLYGIDTVEGDKEFVAAEKFYSEKVVFMVFDHLFFYPEVLPDSVINVDQVVPLLKVFDGRNKV